MARGEVTGTTPGAGAVHPVRPQRLWWSTLAAGRLAYVFLLPAFFFVLVFSYYPAISAIYHAFTAWDGSSTATWSGWANFESFLSDPQFGIALANIMRLTAF